MRVNQVIIQTYLWSFMARCLERKDIYAHLSLGIEQGSHAVSKTLALARVLRSLSRAVRPNSHRHTRGEANRRMLATSTTIPSN